MSDENLTARERRNLELVDQWAATWNQPDGSSEELVNEIYADSTEISAPLQAGVFVESGASKTRFLAMETAAADAMAKRTMIFRQKIARGDTVAVEVEVPYVMNDGREGTDWFAAFLTFDEEGRISADHTFMRNRPFSERKK